MEPKKELTLSEQQEILFEIMKDIDAFCRANNIRYSLSDGTMLGAVRHGGFIPWDDDADLCMPREDFDRFVKTYKSDRYHLLLNTHTEDEVFFYGFAKINDPTTYGATSYRNLSKYGVAVDIFPLEPVPEDDKERAEYTHKIRSLHNRLYHRHRKDLVSVIKSYRHSIDWWWNKIEDALHDGKYSGSHLLSQIIGMPNVEVLVDIERFDNLADIEFQGYKFLGFSDTDSYLKMLFGADYMTPKKWAHNHVVYKK